jgi:DnaJ-class molecular chaperone
MGLREGFDPEAYEAAAHGFAGFDIGEMFGRAPRGSGRGGRVEFNLEDLFGGVGPGPRAAARAPRRGADLESEVTVDLRDAVLGCMTELTVSSAEGERILKVRIPSGVAAEGKIRLRGQGAPGVQGGPAGDLLLKVKVRKHPYFSIRGRQLHVRVPVTPLEAYQGARVGVPTPEGHVQLSIPPGSQNGAKLRLRGKGIELKSKGRGDLIAHLEIVLPKARSEAVEEALRTVQEAFEEDPRQGLEL